MAAWMARPDDLENFGPHFFNNLCHGLASQKVPASDTGLARWIASQGLMPDLSFDFFQLDEALRAGLLQGLRDGAALMLEGSRSRKARPWATHFGLGRYGCDYLVRALTAYKGLGALAADEAVYAMGDFDAARAPLQGGRRYRLRFEPGELPPVDAFWSVTLYDADRFLYPNAIGRHSIGDRTPDLVHDADGGLTLAISHEPPADRRNWLPAPAGQFYLVLRMYLPRPEVRSWTIPPLQAESCMNTDPTRVPLHPGRAGPGLRLAAVRDAAHARRHLTAQAGRPWLRRREPRQQPALVQRLCARTRTAHRRSQPRRDAQQRHALHQRLAGPVGRPRWCWTCPTWARATTCWACWTSSPTPSATPAPAPWATAVAPCWSRPLAGRAAYPRPSRRRGGTSRRPHPGSGSSGAC